MGFTQDKIQIKYILGSYKDSPNYPEPNDIIYLMVKRAADKGLDLTDINFTTTRLYKKLSECKDKNVEKSLKYLEETGQIEKTRETKGGVSYKILKNPYL
jgi:hypothetical protein